MCQEGQDRDQPGEAGVVVAKHDGERSYGYWQLVVTAALLGKFSCQFEHRLRFVEIASG